MRHNDIDWDELKKHFPDYDTFDDPDEYAVCVFRHSDVVGKFIKVDKITEDEMELLGNKLTEEWLKTVIEPYEKSLYDFCTKYEIAFFKNNNSSSSIPMGKLMEVEMLERVSERVLREVLED